LGLRRRVPKTFITVVAFFSFWAGAMLLVAFGPAGSINTLFFLAQQIVGWVFVIAVAIVGALLIGMFISHRLLTHGGFTPFEEEMLRMRKEVTESRDHLEKVRDEVGLMRLEVARLRRQARAPEERAGPMARGISSARAETVEDIAELGR
jgi:uncharacterized protein YneF (UPF0154 family)